MGVVLGVVAVTWTREAERWEYHEIRFIEGEEPELEPDPDPDDHIPPVHGTQPPYLRCDCG